MLGSSFPVRAPRCNVAIVISGKGAAESSIWDAPTPLKFTHYSSKYRVRTVHDIQVYFQKYVDWNTLMDLPLPVSVSQGVRAKVIPGGSRTAEIVPGGWNQGEVGGGEFGGTVLNVFILFKCLLVY